MMLMPRTFLNHIVGCPLIVKATLPLHVGAKRLLSLLGCGADPRPGDECDCTRKHHRDAEMLRADLIQDERREQQDRQHEIEQDDLELGHGCTFAAGELDPSVAPRAYPRRRE